ncbi:MAG: D-lyxose/D-mannose family sugar isomerase [Bacteroidetes bacterium]|nr:MAG: D-lyxose/D-mannose family sugar isomerase [Bacteroidota bacterium]
MKRSEINQLIKLSKEFFYEMNFKLPPWAYWKPEDWKGKYEMCSEIADNMLGWDLTDFGSSDFFRRGLILFTIRNGNFRKDKKPYAEKIMIVEEMQETPTHFHWSKMEDIINRGGGNLVIELWNSTPEEELSNEPFTVKTDGVLRKLLPGDKIILTPGESICLTQGLYHRFYGEAGKGKVLVGEVSAVNDDNSDNRFYSPVGRFPEIEEDETPLHLLVSDYQNYF